jgi:sugar/nucleoside kinase (ribokinase family)
VTSQLDVVGIGSMAVDRMHRCPRILGGDEKGMLRELEGSASVQLRVGGVVLNHLGWAACLGLRTGIFGRQADDEEGRFLRRAMDQLAIERNIVVEGEQSSIAEIFVDDQGARAIYMAPGTTSGTTAEHVERHHAEFIRSALRLTTEVSQLPLSAALAALKVARNAGVATLVDLDVPPSDAVATLGSDAELTEVLRSADVLKPSKVAAGELGGGASDPLSLAGALRERFGNAAVVVTDGELGCAVHAQDFQGVVPATLVKAVDTTGAGDAFLGGLLVGLRHGFDWPNAAALANACGAACAEQLGAFPEDPPRARARVAELYQGPPVPGLAG